MQFDNARYEEISSVKVEQLHGRDLEAATQIK